MQTAQRTDEAGADEKADSHQATLARRRGAFLATG
jgi:hypothetical protein